MKKHKLIYKPELKQRNKTNESHQSNEHHMQVEKLSFFEKVKGEINSLRDKLTQILPPQTLTKGLALMSLTAFSLGLIDKTQANQLEALEIASSSINISRGTEIYMNQNSPGYQLQEVIQEEGSRCTLRINLVPENKEFLYNYPYETGIENPIFRKIGDKWIIIHHGGLIIKNINELVGTISDSDINIPFEDDEYGLFKGTLDGCFFYDINNHDNSIPVQHKYYDTADQQVHDTQVNPVCTRDGDFVYTNLKGFTDTNGNRQYRVNRMNENTDSIVTEVLDLPKNSWNDRLNGTVVSSIPGQIPFEKVINNDLFSVPYDSNSGLDRLNKTDMNYTNPEIIYQNQTRGITEFNSMGENIMGVRMGSPYSGSDAIDIFDISTQEILFHVEGDNNNDGINQNHILGFGQMPDGRYCFITRNGGPSDPIHQITFYYDNSTTPTDNEIVQKPNTVNLTNYPNPFNANTKFSFTLDSDSPVKCGIYNTKGQKVASLVKSLGEHHFTKGTHDITWNGKADNGQTLPSGIYFFSIESKGQRVTHKILKMK